MRLVSVVHEHALVLLARGRGSRRADRRPGPTTGRTSTTGIDQPRGADDLLDDDALRLLRARTRPASPRRRCAWRTCSSNSSNLSGRLSSALGRRKPYSTSVSLRARSPRYIAPTCGTVWCDSSRIMRKSLREVVDERRRRLARLAARQVARVVLDAVAEPHLLHHLEVVHASAARAAASRGSAPPCRRSRAARGAPRGCSRSPGASAPAASRSASRGRSRSARACPSPAAERVDLLDRLDRRRRRTRCGSPSPASYAGKTSTTSPRTRNVPRWKSTSFRSYWMSTSMPQQVVAPELFAHLQIDDEPVVALRAADAVDALTPTRR